ncbi:MAG: sugar transferase [Campylobacteraceae bacterium]
MKRIFDMLFSIFFIVLFFPIMIVVYIALFFSIGSPVIFRQARPGKNEKIFNIYKFRTMTNTKDIDGNLLPDEKRLTKVGKFIRSTSLDELPQFFNILKGDMSFVGPRPLLVEYLPLYNDFQKQRHNVKPGVTGWAQVNGRNTLSWDQKFEYDVWYVKNQSFLLDMKIIFLTIKLVLKRDGVSSKTSATMEKFEGSRSNE